ncbi:hypothetical protein BCR33DRAFT_764776 [Rhizoclosmatium globosum]|uniref:Uncharacterized protein n=1 Tax=Rhizoclosmatium globosum TaxID=329046 RepID=A0A1Y2CHB4_9FUNG|nr:hypothetical protein BCR33DRAFT_764776 [Rhizoclosmatium globosum]|eukprot:ORY46419.1 hypothetical protein BCR33DRAFT_764776 [Rhizoclosmatium globosum]
MVQSSSTSWLPAPADIQVPAAPFPLPGDGLYPTAIHFGPAAPMPPGWPNIPWPPGSELKLSNQTASVTGIDSNCQKDCFSYASTSSVVPLGVSLGAVLLILMGITVVSVSRRGLFKTKKNQIPKEYTNGEYARWLLERTGKQLEDQREVGEEFDGVVDNVGLPSSSKQGSLKY